MSIASISDGSDGKMMNGRTGKFQLCISDEIIQEIDEWSFENRVRTRAAAIRRLIELGLNAPTEAIEKPMHYEPRP